jgi:hypothetical protein
MNTEKSIRIKWIALIGLFVLAGLLFAAIFFVLIRK